MRNCPACDNVNDQDRDFCAACGHYLRWEPTLAGPGAPDTQAAAGAGEAERAAGAVSTATPPMLPGLPQADGPHTPAGGEAGHTHAHDVGHHYAGDGHDHDDGPAPVLLTLRLPGSEEAAPGEVRVRVAAGGQTTLVALVRNQSGIVDNYDLTVEGLPVGWWTVAPATVYLVPFGSPAGACDQDVLVLLTPPRSVEAEARAWPIQLVARSRALSAEMARAEATLVIDPYLELLGELRPQRASGRRKATYAVAVRDQGNAPADVEFTAVDDEEKLRFAFEKERIQTTPGRRAGSRFVVRPARQIWIGRPVEHRFEVQPRVVDTVVPVPPVHALFRQKPWLPYWLMVLLALLAAAAAAAWALWPEDAKPAAKVVVPDVTAAPDLLTAQGVLEGVGLALGDQFQKPTDEAPDGAILDQTPEPGEEVDEGTPVAVNVASATGAPIVKVPRLLGLTLPAATKRLAGRRLAVGKQLSPAPSEDARIAFQSVDPGKEARQGDAIDIDFKKPGAARSGTAPNVAALAVPAAAAVLAEQEIPYTIVRRLSADVPAGEMIEQIPAGGAEVPEGGMVQLVVSAGNPPIAYDDGRDIFSIGSAKGSPRADVATSGDVEVQPAWSPGGGVIAYRRTEAGTTGPLLPGSPSRIWITDVETGNAEPITDSGFDDRRPSFSPNGRVVSFVSNRPGRGSDFDLCFARVDDEILAPECVRGAGLSVSRPAWAPSGRRIIVDAERTGTNRSELAMYVSRRANSSRPSDWKLVGLVSPPLHKPRPGDQVRTAAYSPDGTRVAFAANWRNGAYGLYVSPVLANGRLGKARPVGAVVACEVSWSTREVGQLVVSQRDPTSCEGPGQVVRIDPRSPSTPTVLSRVGAGNSAWYPLPPEG